MTEPSTILKKGYYHIRKRIISTSTVLILFIVFIGESGFAQDTSRMLLLENQADTVHISKNRKIVLASVQTSLWAGTLFSLEKTWYSNYQKSSFKTFNDWNEWQQMDKFGHLFSSYHITEQTTNLWQWAGTNRKKSMLIGAISSLVFMNTIELMDAYSAKWGFSNSDLIANFAGTGLYLSQALGWKEQRVRLKFSYHPREYGDLNERADQLFGKSIIERALKDYNGQTYWTSINLKSFLPNSKLPNWLCLSIGYGADNMLAGFKNEWTTYSGEKVYRNDLTRNRKIMVSADVDLSKLKSNSRFMKTIFSLFNTIKIPAPTIIFNTKDNTKLNLFYF